MKNRIGKQTSKINDVVIIGRSTIAGQKESEGPLGKTIDTIISDSYYGEKSWEKCESKMQKEAIDNAIADSGVAFKEIDMCLCGDLLNQCIGTSYSIRDLSIPHYGQYGACSTMAQTISLGSVLVDGGYTNYAVCGTSSHFCTAERQFRMPLEYGGQRTQNAQWTVTGAGMVVLTKSCNTKNTEIIHPKVSFITTGKIIDKGITDINNMGAAMAPAAADTIIAHFRDTGLSPDNYDLILTGDLGLVGKNIVIDLLKQDGYDVSSNYNDCGTMIFDLDKSQDVHCGGSGCGCSAVVLCGHIMNKLRVKELNSLLFVGTGALMSPTSMFQGESIPAIAHAVAIGQVLLAC